MEAKNSILDPATCGFAKTAAYVVFTQKEKKNITELLNDFLSQLDGCTFHLEVSAFRRFQVIVQNLHKLGKAKPSEKRAVIEYFSNKNWKKLLPLERSQHQLFNCNACLGSYLNKVHLAKFPSRSKVFTKKAREMNLSSFDDIRHAKTAVIENLNKDF